MFAIIGYIYGISFVSLCILLSVDSYSDKRKRHKHLFQGNRLDIIQLEKENVREPYICLLSDDVFCWNPNLLVHECDKILTLMDPSGKMSITLKPGATGYDSAVKFFHIKFETFSNPVDEVKWTD